MDKKILVDRLVKILIQEFRAVLFDSDHYSMVQVKFVKAKKKERSFDDVYFIY